VATLDLCPRRRQCSALGFARYQRAAIGSFHDSRSATTAHLSVGAGPEEILLFLIKQDSRYEPLKYRDPTTTAERRHSRLVRLLADLVAFGHTNPHKASGYLRDALESLRQSGYVANFEPMA
jgi:hypothetical protein